MESWRLVLDLADETLLYNRVPALGFTTVSGFLGMNQALSDGGAAWVHSRDRGNGNIRVGTQRLVVVNSLLESYQSMAALRASAESYGGINTKSVYLSPNGTLLAIGSLTAYAGDNQQSSGGSGTGGSGTQSGDSSSSSSETPAVAAPTISGTTPFEETTTVTMSGPEGATIHYTTDGSTPTSASTVYSEALTLNDTTTVKAIAVKDDVSSGVTTRTFTKGSGNNDSE
ncbi:MAG: chitobiase/beta-hexosaminidase C-terminal domain-containing protein [Bacteroidales bacterium]|nr:chitobiase/beta-hexosaminidase C-terminal domain-containing protein [Bacteroidales bacterium]